MSLLLLIVFLSVLCVISFYILYSTKEKHISLDKCVTPKSVISVITLTDATDCVVKLDDYYFQSDYTYDNPTISKELHIIWKSERFEQRIQKLQDVIYIRTGIRVPIQYHSISDPIV